MFKGLVTLFDEDPVASAAIAVTLVAACVVLAYVLPMPGAPW